MEGETMTDNQFKGLNRLILFIQKLMAELPEDKRLEFQKDFEAILKANSED